MKKLLLISVCIFFTHTTFSQHLRYEVLTYGTDSTMTPCDGYIEFNLVKRKTDYISHVGIVRVKTPHYEFQDSIMGVFMIDWKGRVGMIDAAVINSGFRFIHIQDMWGFFEPLSLKSNMFYETKKVKRKKK
jgi:hypothetical protein